MAIEELRVGGSVSLRGPIKLGIVDVAGSLRIDGDAEAREFKISGSGRITGTLKSQHVEVSGSLDIEEDVHSGEIRVAGSVRVKGDIHCERIEVSGFIRANIIEAIIEAGEINIAGDIAVIKAVAKSIVLSRKTRARGIFTGCKIEIGRDAEVDKVIGEEVMVKRNAEVNYIEAHSVIIEDGAEVSTLKYVEKADISKDAKVGHIEKIEKVSLGIECP